MKQLGIAGALLAALLAWALWEGRSVCSLTESYALRLTQAQELAEAERWDEARRLSDQVMEDLREHRLYLCAQLRHDNVDDVFLTFREAQQYLRMEELEQYAAANARVITQLRLLGEMERPTLENVL